MKRQMQFIMGLFLINSCASMSPEKYANSTTLEYHKQDMVDLREWTSYTVVMIDNKEVDYGIFPEEKELYEVVPGKHKLLVKVTTTSLSAVCTPRCESYIPLDVIFAKNNHYKITGKLIPTKLQSEAWIENVETSKQVTKSNFEELKPVDDVTVYIPVPVVTN